MSPTSETDQKRRSADESLLDAQSKAILDAAMVTDAPTFTECTPAELRAMHEAVFRPLGLKEAEGVCIEKRVIPGPESDLRIWVYRPIGSDDDPLPVLTYFHGGGMMVGSLELYDTLCQHLCAQAGVIVASVDYRLTPEHKYPSANDDCYAAFQWLRKNAAALGGDPHRIAVGGDSAGGMLAAATCLKCRDEGATPPVFQLLIYPAVGKRQDYGSYTEFAKGYLGEPEQLAWFYAQYISSPDQLNDPQVSPILAQDFSSLPPAFILTAGYDILRDEAEHYAQLLSAAGVATELRRYESTFHPFLNAAGVLDVGQQAVNECARKLRDALL